MCIYDSVLFLLNFHKGGFWQLSSFGSLLASDVPRIAFSHIPPTRVAVPKWVAAMPGAPKTVLFSRTKQYQVVLSLITNGFINLKPKPVVLFEGTV